MPHLQCELNFAPPAEERRRFAAAVVRHFSTVMDTGTDHIGVTIRAYGKDDLTFGRAEGPRIAFLNADIRRGRTAEQKRRLARAIIEELHRTWEVSKKGVYVIYTEHDGEHFQMDDRVLPSWKEGEDPLADG